MWRPGHLDVTTNHQLNLVQGFYIDVVVTCFEAVALSHEREQASTREGVGRGGGGAWMMEYVPKVLR